MVFIVNTAIALLFSGLSFFFFFWVPFLNVNFVSAIVIKGIALMFSL